MLVRLDWERNCYEGHLLNELYYRREKKFLYKLTFSSVSPNNFTTIMFLKL
jgi:hypothetical protein